jgi:hypothetical protein
MFSLVGYNQLQSVADLLSTICQHKHPVVLGAENRLPATGGENQYNLNDA